MYYLLDWGSHHKEVAKGTNLEEALENKGYSPQAKKFLDSYQAISIPATGWVETKVKNLISGLVRIYTHANCPDVEKWVWVDVPRVDYYPTHLIMGCLEVSTK